MQVHKLLPSSVNFANPSDELHARKDILSILPNSCRKPRHLAFRMRLVLDDTCGINLITESRVW